MRLRLTVRVRLTALYALVLVASTALLLALSYALLDGPLHRTLPDELARDTLDRVATQYVLALVGATLLAVALGWALAGRVLRPLTQMTQTARRVSQDRLDERIGLDGPDDELRELAATVDAMLDRLAEAFDAQRRFVANASHELRSPLTVVRTEAEVALADPDATPDDLRRALIGVLEASDRTEALLDGLLLLARSTRGLVRLEPLDLAAAAKAAVAHTARDAEREAVTVVLDARPAPTSGDRPLIERLAVNLVENAVRYNRAGGRVEVATFPADGAAVLRVANTGPVLSPDESRRLTQPFERLGRRAGAGGSGLGLSIVQSVVEAHGGTLDVAPRPTGGLDAEVRLPARQEASFSEPSWPRSGSAPSRG